MECSSLFIRECDHIFVTSRNRIFFTTFVFDYSQTTLYFLINCTYKGTTFQFNPSRKISGSKAEVCFHIKTEIFLITYFKNSVFSDIITFLIIYLQFIIYFRTGHFTDYNRLTTHCQFQFSYTNVAHLHIFISDHKCYRLRTSRTGQNKFFFIVGLELTPNSRRRQTPICISGESKLSCIIRIADEILLFRKYRSLCIIIVVRTCRKAENHK